MAKTKTPIGIIISGSYAGENIYALTDRDLAITKQVLPYKGNAEQILINNPSLISAHINSEDVKSLEIILTEDSKMDIGKVHDVNFWLGGKAAYFFNEMNKEKLYSMEIVFNNGEMSLAKFHDNVFNNALEKIQGIQFEVKSKNPSFNAIPQGTPAVSTRININPENVEPTITRIELFLQDQEWAKVAEYCETALDYFPTDYRLYKYLLLSDLKCQSISDLRKCESSFASNVHYKKLLQFADEPLKEELNQALDDIRKERIYKEGCASTDRTALDKFRLIKGYKDADEKAASIENKIKAEEARAKQEKERQRQEQERDRQAKYLAAIELQESAKDLDGFKKALNAFEELKNLTSDDNVKRRYDVVNRHKEISEKCDELTKEKKYTDAISLLASGELSKVKEAKSIFDKLNNQNDYRDSGKKAEEAQEIIDAENKKSRKKLKRIAVASLICIMGLILVGVVMKTIIPNNNYNKAVELMEKEDYEEALEAFNSLGDYKDSKEKAAECQNGIDDANYNAALELMEKEDYEEALEAFDSLGGYKDSKEKAAECQNGIDYNAALELMEKEDYEEALEAFNSLGGYKDSKEKAEKCRLNILKNPSVGSIVCFGKYEQDNNPDNGKEEIEWIVLAKKGKQYLVVSKYALDNRECNNEHLSTGITWEGCDLRKWLNGQFMDKAFSSDEKAKILTTTVTADKYSKGGRDAGNDTKDQVFLLSTNEVKKYFSKDENRRCAPTPYAEEQGAYADEKYPIDGKGSCRWWLRTPGEDHTGWTGWSVNATFYCVESDGSYGEDTDIHVNYDEAIRPALWINP